MRTATARCEGPVLLKHARFLVTHTAVSNMTVCLFDLVGWLENPQSVSLVGFRCLPNQVFKRVAMVFGAGNRGALQFRVGHA
jgi:hypothetical protein